MRPAVLTAVLLLVGIVTTVAALSFKEVESLCSKKGNDCAHYIYWTSFNRGRCMKFLHYNKSFKEAQAYCQYLDSELVSIHNYEDWVNALCMSYFEYTDTKPIPFWIGAQRSGDGFKYTDGTEFNYTSWLPNQPDNYGGQEDCVESNALEWGKWNDNRCSERKRFLCVKKK